MSEKKNLYQKIADVKANIADFTKDTKGYNYDYVSGSQILHKIRAKMEENQLLLFPSIKDTRYAHITVLVKGKEKPNILVEMDMTYTFLNTENPEEKLEVQFFAIGHQDDASKAYGTALTYAERYFLLKFFNIPTDEDDADSKQKRQENTKADKNDMEALNHHIQDFAKLVHVEPIEVKTKLNILNLDKLSVAEVMRALQTLNAWKQDVIKQNQGGQSS